MGFDAGGGAGCCMPGVLGVGDMGERIGESYLPVFSSRSMTKSSRFLLSAMAAAGRLLSVYRRDGCWGDGHASFS